MKISEFKAHLVQVKSLQFKLPDNSSVPEHFHITELGKISKHYIDCGGVERFTQNTNFQIWFAEDFEHRLSPSKLLNIIQMAETKLNLPDVEIEMEYQSDTIGKYHLGFVDGAFTLLPMQTDCLAKDKCGIPEHKTKLKMANLGATNSCEPGNGCC